jgi:WD40 repeat protein
MELFTLNGHTGGVLHAAWSGDDKQIVTASQDGSAKLWNAETGMELLTLSGHKGSVLHATWSGDDERILTASEDGSAKVWDAGTGAELFTLSRHTDRVRHAAWNSDDSRIVTASEDGTAQVYFARMVGREGLIEFACTRTDRNFTHTEWQHYIGPDAPYRRTCPNLPVGPQQENH